MFSRDIMLDEAFDLMQRGGALMWAILLVSVVAVAFASERFYILWIRYRLDLDVFVDHLIDLLDSDKHARALEVCSAEGHHPFASVAKAGLMRADGTEREIQRAMEAAALRHYPNITRRTGHLAMLANVATLLGLLGTVLGLIKAFRGMSEADAAAKQEILSRGIGVAMFTTAFGLMTAIVAVVSSSILHARQARLLAQIEGKATELLNHLTDQGRSSAKRAV